MVIFCFFLKFWNRIPDRSTIRKLPLHFSMYTSKSCWIWNLSLLDLDDLDDLDDLGLPMLRHFTSKFGHWTSEKLPESSSVNTSWPISVSKNNTNNFGTNKDLRLVWQTNQTADRKKLSKTADQNWEVLAISSALSTATARRGAKAKRHRDEDRDRGRARPEATVPATSKKTCFVVELLQTYTNIYHLHHHLLGILVLMLLNHILFVSFLCYFWGCTTSLFQTEKKAVGWP